MVLTETVTCAISLGNFCLLARNFSSPPATPAPACGCTCHCAEAPTWQPIAIGVLIALLTISWLPRLLFRSGPCVPVNTNGRVQRGQLTSGPPGLVNAQIADFQHQ